MEKIDHIGIVVKNIDDAISQWRICFGYSQHTNPVTNTRQKVKVVFMSKPGSITIKLTEPLDDTSPIFAFAKKGGGLHHLCFKTDNLESEISTQKSNGLYLLSPPQPGEAFNNENIAFLLAKNNLNIELIDTDQKASTICDQAE